MGFFRICKSRYPLNPSYLHCTFKSHPCQTLSSPTLLPTSDFTNSSIGYPSFSRLITSIASKSYLSSILPSGSVATEVRRSFYVPNVCFYSSCVNTVGAVGEDGGKENRRLGVFSVDINRVIDIVKSDGSGVENRLDGLGLKLPKWCVIEILRVLNVSKVPAMRFFEWVRGVHPDYSRNADICSLMVDNCGRLGDYESMLALLKDFRVANICLTDQAFGFLPIVSATKETRKSSIREIVKVLDEVGGSCRNSGIYSLLELLASLNAMDLAKFVMEITERKVSYYNILVRHLCMREQFKYAKNVLEEMRLMKCEPETNTYNFFISGFCKLGRLKDAHSILEEMLHRGCTPDEITFETLIYFDCRRGRSEHAVKLFNQMESLGIKPRLPTHCAFIRGYFNAQEFDKAYKYVINTAKLHPWSAEGLYNELASHHQKDGDLVVARNLLIEMIQKGYKPRYLLYQRVYKRLCKTGKEGMATDLKMKLSTFMRRLRQNNR